ncbi:ATP-binding cassette sub-family C member 5 [Hyalella azteca]|uniref:ATP-binding cassette sub-family C member 5 n=1 Tax=Hyalella azteca TaxID=294128 RepID=A0A979FT44_HYAAZ|nr:ATP-binding cassette sub-family C member 5 [Hyalella azteca]
MGVTDERVRRVGELLTSIRLIKLYAWETCFATAITGVLWVNRGPVGELGPRQERALLERCAYLQSLGLAMAPTVPVIAAIVTFVAHIAAGNNLTPAQATSVMGLIGLVHFGLDCVTFCVHHLREGQVSLGRLQSVLQLQERQAYVTGAPAEGAAVALRRASFAWPPLHKPVQSSKAGRALSPAHKMLLDARGAAQPLLCDISLSVAKGELVGVCGGVGSGKSSLLHAILGRMTLLGYDDLSVGGLDDAPASGEEEFDSEKSPALGKNDGIPHQPGTVAVQGDIAYVGQQAWILNASVRDNILFGEPFDPLKYYRVVYACSLTQDLDALPAGDLTEVGERGVNLSGGQKQRLSLARALYSSRSVYLLDDPLSAVDVQVGWHIFRWAIKTGLKKATVILVTHQLQYLPECDRVVLLQGGRIIEQGPHAQLMRDDGEYAALYTSHQNATNPQNTTNFQNTSNHQNTTDPQNTTNPQNTSNPQNITNDQNTTDPQNKTNPQNTTNLANCKTPISRTRSSSAGHVKALDRSYTDVSFESWRRKRTVSSASTGSAAYGGNVAIGGPVMEEEDGLVASLYSDSGNLVDHDSRPSSFSGDRRASSMSGPKDPKVIPGGAITTEERVQSGSVQRSTFFAYINAAGGMCVAAAVVLSFGVNVGTTAFSSWWLSHWLAAGSGANISHVENIGHVDNITDNVGYNSTGLSNSTWDINSNNTSPVGINVTFDSSNNIADNPHLNFYLSVYGSTVIFILATSLLRGVIFMKTSIHASTRLHDQVLNVVFRSPLTFFDTTPVGRILNIFSRDMDEVDVRLPMSLEMFLQNIWLVSCSLLLVCLVFWQFLPMLVILAIIFMVIRNIFRIGIRDFKRLENVSRSPLYSHVSTTLSGLDTIHAYGKQDLFSNKFYYLFDESSTAFYLFNCAMRWLAIRLDMLALGVTTCTAILTVLLRGQVAAAFAGLALAYSSQLSGIFQYTVRLSTETEARFTSVERIQSYIETLESEGQHSEVIPPATWPTHGRICFRNVAMRYRHNTPLVFRDLSFDVHEAEKIGVVGRTGSGKSSLAVCLFRLVELSAGVVRIDGADISKLSLPHLRSRLSVIPQDPVLFSGTVRHNLDPHARHPDARVWWALERVQLRERVAALPLQLADGVAEGGDNFSLGERQLLCLARALLRDSKILVLDEATASIDTESDSLVQCALRTAFAHCTLIIIAHRVNTIMWCDRIMVMEAGTIAQLDSPANLMRDTNGIFARMLLHAHTAEP